jgi:hypothetical protein
VEATSVYLYRDKRGLLLYESWDALAAATDGPPAPFWLEMLVCIAPHDEPSRLVGT